MSSKVPSRGASAVGKSSGRILFPTNFGSAANHAWPHALSQARKEAAGVIVLQVVELLAADYENGASVMGAHLIEDSFRRTNERVLARMRAEANLAGVPIQTEVTSGHVGKTILRVAKETRASLIVMGSRGRSVLSPIRRKLSEWVVAHAPCPVYVVPLAQKPPQGASSFGLGKATASLPSS